jgi:hypothetical protein
MNFIMVEYLLQSRELLILIGSLLSFFLNGIGKSRNWIANYYEQVLKPVSLAFNGLLGYEGHRAKKEVDEEQGFYVEDQVFVHATKKFLVESKRLLGISLLKNLCFNCMHY